jgi:hypothetical protein
VPPDLSFTVDVADERSIVGKNDRNRDDGLFLKRHGMLALVARNALGLLAVIRLVSTYF